MKKTFVSFWAILLAVLFVVGPVQKSRAIELVPVVVGLGIIGGVAVAVVSANHAANPWRLYGRTNVVVECTPDPAGIAGIYKWSNTTNCCGKVYTAANGKQIAALDDTTTDNEGAAIYQWALVDDHTVYTEAIGSIGTFKKHLTTDPFPKDRPWLPVWFRGNFLAASNFFPWAHYSPVALSVHWLTNSSAKAGTVMLSQPLTATMPINTNNYEVIGILSVPASFFSSTGGSFCAMSFSPSTNGFKMQSRPDIEPQEADIDEISDYLGGHFGGYGPDQNAAVTAHWKAILSNPAGYQQTNGGMVICTANGQTYTDGTTGYTVANNVLCCNNGAPTTAHTLYAGSLTQRQPLITFTLPLGITNVTYIVEGFDPTNMFFGSAYTPATQYITNFYLLPPQYGDVIAMNDCSGYSVGQTFIVPGGVGAPATMRVSAVDPYTDLPSLILINPGNYSVLPPAFHLPIGNGQAMLNTIRWDQTVTANTLQ